LIRVTTVAAVGMSLLAPAAGQARVTTFVAVADAHADASAPGRSHGRARSLAVDAAPRSTAYLRFDLRGLTGEVAKATLRVSAIGASRSGFAVRRTAATGWSERALTYRSRPSFTSPTLSRSGSYGRGRRLSLDVTAAVAGSGRVGVALVGVSSKRLLVAAREAGPGRRPTLVVQTTDPSTAPAPGAGAGAAAGEAAMVGALRPYDAASPWNTPIAADVPILTASQRYVDAIVDNKLPLTSDPDQYALPVYAFDAQTPRQTVRFSGSFAAYDHGDDSRVSAGYGATVSGVPVPAGAVQSAGSDGQIVFWDPSSGVEWSFWQFERAADGGFSATNGVRYRTTAGNYGRFADGRAGRGAGTPYLAGLVRPWEIAQGHIDHALAFAYNAPASAISYPASKSDGGGVSGTDAPEGTRLQLDPSLTEADFAAWGLAPEAKIIARALQRYGMYVIDNSGSSKIYLEDRLTAGWHAGITRNLTSKIPLSRLRAVAAPVPPA
jgi:hypothetical protein